MTLKSTAVKLALCAIAVDLLFYWVVFHSGIVLPVINPSIEEYQQRVTSFPREAGQQMGWILLHFPTALVASSLKLPDRYLVYLVGQTGLIFFALGFLIDRRQGRSSSKRGKGAK